MTALVQTDPAAAAAELVGAYEKAQGDMSAALAALNCRDGRTFQAWVDALQKTKHPVQVKLRRLRKKFVAEGHLPKGGCPPTWAR